MNTALLQAAPCRVHTKTAFAGPGPIAPGLAMMLVAGASAGLWWLLWHAATILF